MMHVRSHPRSRASPQGKRELFLHEKTQYPPVMPVLWLCLWLLKIIVGQTMLEYWLSLAVFLFSFTLALKWSLMSLWMVWGGSGAEGTERICAYHVLLLTGVSVQLCGRAHLHTERRRKEEWERNGGRMVGGGEKKLMPARHPIWGRFRQRSQRDFIVPKTASSVFVCVRVHV